MFLLLSCKDLLLYILDFYYLPDMRFGNRLPLIVSFAMQKLCSFIESHFSCLCFWCHIYKSLLRPTSRSFSPTFSSRNFRVSSLTFQSLIYFKLPFVGGIRIQFYSFASAYAVFPAPCFPY